MPLYSFKFLYYLIFILLVLLYMFNIVNISKEIFKNKYLNYIIVPNVQGGKLSTFTSFFVNTRVVSQDEKVV